MDLSIKNINNNSLKIDSLIIFFQFYSYHFVTLFNSTSRNMRSRVTISKLEQNKFISDSPF